MDSLGALIYTRCRCALLYVGRPSLLYIINILLAPPDNLLHLPGRHSDWNAKSVRRDRPADPRGVDKLQALQTRTVRRPEGKPAASEGADGEVRGSRSSLVRMRDMDPPEVPIRQAPYNTPQDVASNSGSLVQVAEQAHRLVQRRPLANPMREHRSNCTHEEVVVGGGATPHGWPQVTQEGHVGRARERGET